MRKKKNNERVIYKKEKIMNQEKDEFFKLLKEWNITKDLDECEACEAIVMETLERSLLKSLKEDMIKKIEAIKTTEEMKEFALECAKAVLNDYERDLKNKKCDKKK